MCLSNNYVVKTLQRRVKDGTSCKRGTNNKCIAGRCRNVGCDLVLDSDAVEDSCGVCNGDASTCEIIDEVYREHGKGYQKIVTIPAGSRQITVEEMKPSNNFLALSAADGKTFYLNGNQEIDPDGESKIAGSISVYSNVEPGQESLIISGPIKEDLILYILNNADPNPGIHYRFSIPSTSSGYKPKFSWQLVNWSPCSVYCGGGTQFSEPSCIEEKGGKVSKKHCEKLPKPEVSSRVCNQETCRIRWRTGEWSKCNGCVDKPGHRFRVVDCVKQSPFEDSEVIIEESECKKVKPSNKESCTSNEPCEETSPKRQVSFEDELVPVEDEPQRYEASSNCRENKMKPIAKEENSVKNSRNRGRCGGNGEDDDDEERSDDDDDEERCDDDEDRNNKPSKKKEFRKGNKNNCDEETTTMREGLVVDRVNPEKLKVFQIPMTEDVDDFNLSDEALENVGDKVASPIDTTKMKEIKGEEAQRVLQDIKKKNQDNDDNEDDEDYDYVNTKENQEKNENEDESEC
jgi:hypothetical protein